MMVTGSFNGRNPRCSLLVAPFLLLLVLLPLTICVPSVSAGNVQWLRVEGSAIVREDGAAMILRGANLAPLDSSYVDASRYAMYLDAVGSMGFNVVRLPILWARLEPSVGRYSSGYAESIRRIVNLAGRRGIYVVVDMHQLRLDGFPSWILKRFKTIDEANIGFWNDHALQRELIMTWRMLASTLSDEEAMFGYDLLNEPYAGGIPWNEFAAILNDFYSRTISEIRSVDARHSILFEPVEATAILGEHVLLKPEGDNIIFSPHMYVRGPMEYLQNVVQRIHNVSTNAWNIPLWVGEFGGAAVDIKDQDSLDNLAGILSAFDRYKIGWAYWSLGETSAGARLLDGKGHASDSLITIMTRVFPVSYSEADIAFSWNGTRFQLVVLPFSESVVYVSVPSGLPTLAVRCVGCISVWDSDSHSLRIDARSEETAFFYMDRPEAVSQLKKAAELDYEQAALVLTELEESVVRSSIGRTRLDEVQALVDSMHANLTVDHYEFVLNKLERVIELQMTILEEEQNYRLAEEYVESVRRQLLASQGNLTRWQLTLLSNAYESLASGEYVLAMEWAEKATNAPKESSYDGEHIISFDAVRLVSVGLLGLVALLILVPSLVIHAGWYAKPRMRRGIAEIKYRTWESLREDESEE